MNRPKLLEFLLLATIAGFLRRQVRAWGRRVRAGLGMHEFCLFYSVLYVHPRFMCTFLVSLLMSQKG